MLTLETLFADAWAVIRPNVDPVECAHIIDFWDQVTQTYPNITFQQAINNIPQSHNNTKVNNVWASWCVVVLFDELDKTVRRAFAERIDDPVTLFLVWRKLRDRLDTDEKVYLRKRFEEMLPTIKQEILEGRI